MKTKTANKLTGQLIFNYATNSYWFRVYDASFGYKDYELLHSDLIVTINDEDATLYEDKDECWLDHSPQTLGITTNE